MAKKKRQKKKRRSFKGKVSLPSRTASHVRTALSRCQDAKKGLTAKPGYSRRAYMDISQAETRLAHLL